MIFDRTFHPDEANQAFTVGKLLETGNYVYQPEDHHGPTLYYAAAALQKAYGHDSTATLDGTLLRCTPLLFAVLGLVFGFLALYRIFTFKALIETTTNVLGGSRLSRPCKTDATSASLPDAITHSKCRTNSALKAFLAMVLLGSSPIFVFFATDFIQEMLLTCFTLMMFWAGTAYLLPGNKWKPGTWALIFGIAAGLAFATKETSLLTFAAAFLAGWCVRPFRPHTHDDCQDRQAGALSAVCGPHTHDDCQDRQAGAFSTTEMLQKPASLRQVSNPFPQVENCKSSARNRPGSAALQAAILASLGFLLTAILFYSSFCSNWQGVYNAFIAAPLSYLNRAAGSAASTGASWHVHPWWQYLEWLFLGKAKISNGAVGPHIYTATSNMQIGITALLCCGIPLLFRRVRQAVSPTLLRTAAFLVLYAVLLLIFYSAIPYKTPWCTLQIHVGYVLASFIGILVFGEIIAAVSRWQVRRLERTDPAAASCKRHPSKDTIISIVAAVIVATTIAVEYRPQLVRIFRDPDSKDIPYNYAAASPEVKDLAATVATAISPSPPTNSPTHQPTNSQTHQPSPPFIAVALPPADTWPFPWYNRPYEPQTGYWTSFDGLKQLAAADMKPAVVIVPMEEGHLVQPLFPYLKNTKRFYMRPGVRVRVFW